MSPDEAVGVGARAAMEIVQGMRDQGLEPTAERLLNALKAVSEGTVYVTTVLAVEAVQPGTIRGLSAGDREHFLREARSVAAGALLVYALCPGVEELPSPKLN